MPTLSSAIAKNLKRFRLRKWLTQEQLSKIIGISRQTISTYESGEAQVSSGTITKLAKALDIEETDLVTTPIEIGGKGEHLTIKFTGAMGPQIKIKMEGLKGYSVLGSNPTEDINLTNDDEEIFKRVERLSPAKKVELFLTLSPTYFSSIPEDQKEQAAQSLKNAINLLTRGSQVD